MRPLELPWLNRAIQALDLRRRDRLLLVEPGIAAVATATAQRIGPTGSLTVVEPHRNAAEAIAESVPQATVLAFAADGEESFGSFDAVLVIPFAQPPVELSTWSGLLHGNLRPGGRFVVDLPGPTMLADAVEAAIEARLPCADRIAERLSGPDAATLVASLKGSGMRRIEQLLDTHLLQLSSPFDLADLVAASVHLDEDERLQLGEAVARRRRTTGALDTTVRRTAVAGMR